MTPTLKMDAGEDVRELLKAAWIQKQLQVSGRRQVEFNIMIVWIKSYLPKVHTDLLFVL